MDTLATRNLKAATLLITLTTISLLLKHGNSQFPRHPSYIFHSCYRDNSGNYTQNSSFDNNLKSVLSDLATHASVSQFHASSAGSGRSTAYGLYYCRHDLSLQLCSDCVNMAITNASAGSYCYPLMEGGSWYQECTLRYSNNILLGVYEDWPRGWWYSRGIDVSDPDQHNKVLSMAMKRNIGNAAIDNVDGFVIAQDEVSPSETLYSLVQCRPDINGSVCQSCLLVFFLCSVILPLFRVTQSGCSSIIPLASLGKNGSYYITRIVVPVGAGILLLLALLFGGLFCFGKRNNRSINMVNSSQVEAPRHIDIRPVAPNGHETPYIRNIECFDFKTIEGATMNFSDDIKLGQGGFGSVYKGLLNGQLIAVKRLARNTGQGVKEFETEVAVLAKLQHRNLVTLVGFSIHQEERILVYEFLPNLSLDKFLFDATKSIYLDWRRRYKIIEGIAWGLRYLHIDSLLTIIHRDLKSSNILLDNEMNPKIADFGLAKLVMVDHTTVNTSTIAGTHGYMAPEYAMAGQFSAKSDIYSFGVIILEIITGKSINHFFDRATSGGLLHCVWKHWSEGSIEGLIDPILKSNYPRNEVERCVHIGLLCVQDDTTRRPTIRVLLGMLENNSTELPYPSASSIVFHNIYNATSRSTTSPSGQTNSSQMEFQHELKVGLYAR